MPSLSINNSQTVTNYTGLRLNIVTVSGPKGDAGRDGTGIAGFYVSGSEQLLNPTLSGVGGIVVYTLGNNVLFSGGRDFTATIEATGQALDAKINYVSGVLSSGAVSQSGALSQTITTTGALLNNKIDASSGYFAEQITLLGTGSSAALAQTGALLINLNSVTSGQLSSGFSTALTASGAALQAQSNSNATNLSGSLLAASGYLQNQINANSGVQLYVTGSGPLSEANFIGIGGLEIFRSGTNVVISGGTTVSITGYATESQLNSLSGWASSAVNVAQTGSTLDNKINSLSGSTATSLNGLSTAILNTGALTFATANNNATNLSGNLAATGSYLLGLINASSAGVSSINSASGALTIAGLGSVTVTTDGQTIYVSGGAQAQTGDFATNASLTQTGALLYNALTGYSGLASVTFATNTALHATGTLLAQSIVATGTALTVSINALSGDAATKASLTQTGVNILQAISNQSGFNANTYATQQSVALASGINSTGISNVSDRLVSTGQLLAGALNTYSGYAQNTFATTQALNASGTLVLAAANSNAQTLSGDLSATGATLLGLISAASAGVSSINAASGALSLTGAGNVSVIVNGQAITVSGDTGVYAQFARATDLTSSGSYLYSTIVNASGAADAKFATTGALFSTGAQAVAIANNNATNLSGNLSETGSIIIGLINAASAGVSSINGASGVVNVIGAGNVSVTTNGATITVSGDTGQYAFFATKVDLQTSGSNLSDKVNSLSGYTTAGFAAYDTRLIDTGNAAISYANGLNATTLSALAATGSTLDGKINTLSGYADSTFARVSTTDSLSGNLTQTGVVLLGKINALSGFVGAVSGTLQTAINAASQSAQDVAQNLTQTGVTLTQRINSLSGFVNVISGVNATGIFNTGVAAMAYADQLANTSATNIAQTGSTLDNKINALSGYSLNTFATITSVGTVATNLAQTGSNLSQRIDTVTTNLTATGETLGAKIATTGQAAWTAAQNNAVNLSGNLQSTGQNLQAQIDAIASASGALLNNVVFTTGNQLIAGNKYFAGNTYIDNLFVTGQQTVINTQSISVADNWMTLNATGGARDSAIFVSTGLTGASDLGGVLGFDVPSNTWRYGISNQASDLSLLPRIASGEAVDALNSAVTSLSGFTVAADNALNTKIFDTGAAAVAYAQTAANAVATNLTQTGVTLGAKIDSLSGYSNGTFATAANVTQTGVTLGAKVDALSGYANSTFSTNANVFNTGFSAVVHANGIGSGLSGRLTQTGVDLNARIGALSGYVNATFATQANLGTTGTTLNDRIASLSGYSASAANLTLTGQQLINFTNSTATNLSGTIAVTGIVLDGKINALSGYSNSTFATAANLTQTGITLQDRIGSLSGYAASDVNLQATGTTLNNRISSLSGYANSTFATAANLTQSGVVLGGKVDSLSGYSNTVFATKADVTLTGVALGAKINSLSGYVFDVSGALQAQINASPGSNSDGINLSGNLYFTGSTLDQRINALSGYAVNNFSTGYSPAANANRFRAMAARYSTAVAQTLTTSYETIGFEIKAFDSENAVTGTGSTFAWVAPESGYYNVSATIESFAVATANNQYLQAAIFVNGVERFISVGRVASSNQASNVIVAGVVEALSGQPIVVKAASSLGASRTLSARPEANYLSISRVGGFVNFITGAGNTGTDAFVQTGTILAYTTGIVTGADFVYINHQNYTFPTVPRISVELEPGPEGYIYAHAISGRSTTGFFLLFSDIVAETGMVANVIAKS